MNRRIRYIQTFTVTTMAAVAAFVPSRTAYATGCMGSGPCISGQDSSVAGEGVLGQSNGSTSNTVYGVGVLGGDSATSAPFGVGVV
jgi:hypothetical protein